MKINVFDLDDTLIISRSKIKVLDVNTGEVIKELTPQEFNSFTPKPRHALNFDDFRSLEILKASKIIKWVKDILLRSVAKGRDVAMITLRSDKDVLEKFLNFSGLPIPSENIFAVSDSRSGIDQSLSGDERKKVAMQTLIDRGYTKIRMFDDSLENLRTLKTLEDDNPGVKIETKWIKEKWIN